MKKLALTFAAFSTAATILLLTMEKDAVSDTGAPSLLANTADEETAQPKENTATPLVKAHKQSIQRTSTAAYNEISDESPDYTPAPRERTGDQEHELTFEELVALTNTAETTTPEEEGVSGNEKPQINADEKQRLQTLIYAWEFTEESPVNEQLNFGDLFTDADNDLLSYQVTIDSETLSASTLVDELFVSGTGPEPEQELTLQIGAKDSFHDEEETPWTTASFSLPLAEAATDDDKHPLVGQTFYRLESGKELGGKVYGYDVAYCQAVHFINGEMYFASSDTKTDCPSDSQLAKVGTYSIIGNELIATSSLGSGYSVQTWIIRNQYQQSEQDQEILVTVSRQSGNDTYLLQNHKYSAERRLFPTHKYQHSYYYPTGTNQYSKGYMVLHLDQYDEPSGPNGEYTDADINFEIPITGIDCEMVAPYFASLILADTDGELTSDAAETGGYDCRPSGENSFIDFNFPAISELVDGKIYTIIGKVKLEYRDKWEDLKLNAYYNEENNIFPLD